MAGDGRYLWRHAARFALVVFVVFSFLPVWTAWYFSSWEGNGELGSFWTMLASIPRAVERPGAGELVLDVYGPELVKLVVLVGVSLVIGRWWASRFR